MKRTFVTDPIPALKVIEDIILGVTQPNPEALTVAIV